jgi:hypothetical protein
MDLASHLLNDLRYALFVKTHVLAVTKGDAVMPNDPFYIVCPYYYKVIGNNLFCESFSGDDEFLTDECRIKQSFSNRKQRNDFIKKYCSCFNYSACTIATINSLISKDTK